MCQHLAVPHVQVLLEARDGRSCGTRIVGGRTGYVLPRSSKDTVALSQRSRPWLFVCLFVFATLRLYTNSVSMYGNVPLSEGAYRV